MKEEDLLLKSTEDKIPTSWSSDGRFLMYIEYSAKTRKGDLWVLPLQGERKPMPFLQTDFNETDGRFSPEMHWVAYVSDESGSNEVYVRGFSQASGGHRPNQGGSIWYPRVGGLRPGGVEMAGSFIIAPKMEE
jgi:Tol biopolymer transport system component